MKYKEMKAIIDSSFEDDTEDFEDFYGAEKLEEAFNWKREKNDDYPDIED